MPLRELMARASETSCCRYFLYSSADDSATIIKQIIAIPAYSKIFLITFRPAKQFASYLYEWARAFVPYVVGEVNQSEYFVDGDQSDSRAGDRRGRFIATCAHRPDRDVPSQFRPHVAHTTAPIATGWGRASTGALIDSDKCCQHLGGQVIDSFSADDESEKQIGDHYAKASCPDVKSESASGRYIF